MSISAGKKKLRYSEANHLGSLFENIIFAAVILVVILVLLEHAAVIDAWPVTSRQYLVMADLAFHLLFTFEFAARLVMSSRNGLGSHYLLHQQGWIDFLTSILLLLLESLPQTLALFEVVTFKGLGIGFLVVIKVVKVINVNKVLHLLGMLKANGTGSIKHAESFMANRHVRVIATTVVTTLILIYSLFNFSNYLGLEKTENTQKKFYSRVIKNLNTLQQPPGRDDITTTKKLFEKLLFETGPDGSRVIQIYYKNELILSNYTLEALRRQFHFKPAAPVEGRFRDINVRMMRDGDFILYLNFTSLRIEQSRFQLVLLLLVLAAVASLMFFYARHFALTISDPIYAMKAGLEAAANPDFTEDEVFLLVNKYNEERSSTG